MKTNLFLKTCKDVEEIKPRSPTGKEYKIVNSNSIYGDISCLCRLNTTIDLKKTCGIILENFKKEYRGTWRCKG